MPIRYQVIHTTEYSYTEAVPLCQNEVHLRPRGTTQQRCLEHLLSIRPTPHKMDKTLDFFGNPVHFFTIQERHLKLSVTARNEVEIVAPPTIAAANTPTWEKVRDVTRAADRDDTFDARQFVFDSPHVTLTPELAEYAAPSFVPGRSWMLCIMDLTARIHREFAYDPAATSVSTPLETVLKIRRGVCQDFAHLQIGCLRSLGLPARYVSGYLRTIPPAGQPRLVGADASHAWVSCYCPDLGWVDFDPTNNVVPSTDHITVAWGRDYSDVCPIRGVFVGGGHHGIHVSVDVRRIGGSE